MKLLSYDAGPEKLTIAMATNATPDFMQDGLSRLAPGIQGNLCADVTDLIGRLGGILLKGFEKEGVKDGKNYYVPTNTNNGYNFAVNIDLAKTLNVFDLLPADKIHWSYAQFLDFCRKATAAGKSKSIYATQLFCRIPFRRCSVLFLPDGRRDRYPECRSYKNGCQHEYRRGISHFAENTYR